AVDTTVGARRRPLSVADRAAVAARTTAAARAATAARATAPTRAMSARAGTGAVQPVRFAPSPFLGVGAAVIAGRREVRAVLVAAPPRAARRATGIVAAGAARRATGIAPTGAARRATGIAPTGAARRATGVAHAAAAGLRPSTPRLNAAASAAVASGAGRQGSVVVGFRCFCAAREGARGGSEKDGGADGAPKGSSRSHHSLRYHLSAQT